VPEIRPLRRCIVPAGELRLGRSARRPPMTRSPRSPDLPQRQAAVGARRFGLAGEAARPTAAGGALRDATRTRRLRADAAPVHSGGARRPSMHRLA
jgi:hypothetical protein